jgi:hypothetical protein
VQVMVMATTQRFKTPAYLRMHDPVIIILRTLWDLLRLLIVVVMGVLEPIIRTVLIAFAIVLAPVAIVLQLIAPPGAHIHSWAMLAMAAGCLALVAIYWAILEALSA